MATNEAAKDLRKKLQLEAKLRRKINSYHDRVVSEFRSIYARTGTTINTNSFNDELVQTLNDHWSETVSAFSKQIGPQLPKDVQETEGERKVIEEALLLWLASGIVKDHAQEINVTTQRQVNVAVDLAADEEIVREQTGREYRLTLAAVAAGTLRNNLKRRVESIIATETQIPAEAAKATEAEVLSGISPSIQAPTNRKVDLQKEWVSVGDSRVRAHHLDADGQRVGVNDSFVVNGELLRYPGDASQGASAGNIINCRCSAVYDRDEIVNLRRG